MQYSVTWTRGHYGGRHESVLLCQWLVTVGQGGVLLVFLSQRRHQHPAREQTQLLQIDIGLSEEKIYE